MISVLVPDALTPLVVALMRDAADRAILPRYRSLEAHEVSAKSFDDVVTIADQQSKAILAKGLARLLPGAAIVGEEAAHADPALSKRLGDALCWIIDPLGATNNSAGSQPPFGILVALAEVGETIAGWIYDPLTGRCCHAARGHGAFVNGERIQSAGSGQAKPVVALLLALADPGYAPRMRELLEPRCLLVDIPRCAAEQYPRLALGQNDIAFVNRTLAWNHAAGVLFLNEAGSRAALRRRFLPRRQQERAAPCCNAVAVGLDQRAAEDPSRAGSGCHLQRFNGEIDTLGRAAGTRDPEDASDPVDLAEQAGGRGAAFPIYGRRGPAPWADPDKAAERAERTAAWDMPGRLPTRIGSRRYSRYLR